jgi:hypothetical protein
MRPRRLFYVSLVKITIFDFLTRHQLNTSSCPKSSAKSAVEEVTSSSAGAKSPTKTSATRTVRPLLPPAPAPLTLVLATQSIANVVKSSLGPVGLDKMLVDDIGVSLKSCDRELTLGRHCHE